jgi:hypothetical protein
MSRVTCFGKERRSSRAVPMNSKSRSVVSI